MSSPFDPARTSVWVPSPPNGSGNVWTANVGIATHRVTSIDRAVAKPNAFAATAGDAKRREVSSLRDGTGYEPRLDAKLDQAY